MTLDGKPLESIDQTIELRMQDVVIPNESGKISSFYL